MKNYRDSNYAVNKYSKAIVYRFTDKVIEVTLEAYTLQKIPARRYRISRN